MFWPVDLRHATGRQRRLGPILRALLTEGYPAEVADDAEERSAVVARIAFGCTFFITTGTAKHQISFAKILRHQIPWLERIGANVNFLPRLINRGARNANCETGRIRAAMVCSV